MKEFISFIVLCNVLVWSIFWQMDHQLPNPLTFLGSMKALLIMATPAIAAILNSLLWHQKIPNLSGRMVGKISKWFGIALFLPLAVAGLSVGISMLYPHVHFLNDFTGMLDRNPQFSPQELAWAKEQYSTNFWETIPNSILLMLQAGWGMSALMAFGEEFAWRGYLVKLLQKHSFWTVCVLIGPIWGLWHAPLILQGHNYPSNPQLGVLMMALACFAMTPLMLYLTLKSQSVWVAAVFHGSFNACFSLSLAPVSAEASNFEVGFLGFSGVLAFLILFAIISWKDRKNLNQLLQQF